MDQAATPTDELAKATPAISQEPVDPTARPLSTPDDHIPAACGRTVVQSASAAALQTSGRGFIQRFLRFLTRGS